MTPAEPTAAQLRRDPLPLLGRVAVVTGVSRRAGIGYAIARRLAALGAGLFLHHYAPHDRDQPWGADPGGPEAVLIGVTEALADGAGHTAGRVQHGEFDLSDPDAPDDARPRPAGADPGPWCNVTKDPYLSCARPASWLLPEFSPR